jgi:hypothetical protein
MQFRSRKDGKHYPVGGKGVSRQTFARVSGQDRRRHSISKERRAMLKTLENPLLYHNFKKRLEKLNPDLDVESLIDSTLEPEEALFDIKRKHPEVNIGLKAGAEDGFREFLDEFGITNEKVQNLVAMQPNPLSDDELAQLSYILNNRPAQSIRTDNALKAPVTKDLRKWIKHPNRTDLQGVDTPKRK